LPRYILLHKPYGYLTQFTPEPGSDKPTLKDLVPVSRVYPVGRLDHDSEGLLLLTDDGALQHRLSDPKFAHPRTYWAQVEGVAAADSLEKLRCGVPIQDYVTRPASVQVLDSPDVEERRPPIRVRASIPTSWWQLILTEGRNRQVRKMTAAVGHPTLRLIRVAIGGLSLSGLKPGEWRDLTKEELASLVKTL
jgi:23S rRNA pseudouridine2457 synthase